MAAYPSFTQLIGSTVEWLDDLKLDRAVNGSAKGRAFYTAKKKRFRLKHQLTSANLVTLDDFYDDYRLVLNTFTWAGDGASYSVIFEGAPRITPMEGGLFDVEVTMAEQ